METTLGSERIDSLKKLEDVFGSLDNNPLGTRIMGINSYWEKTAYGWKWYSTATTSIIPIDQPPFIGWSL